MSDRIEHLFSLDHGWYGKADDRSHPTARKERTNRPNRGSKAASKPDYVPLAEKVRGIPLGQKKNPASKPQPAGASLASKIAAGVTLNRSERRMVRYIAQQRQQSPEVRNIGQADLVRDVSSRTAAKPSGILMASYNWPEVRVLAYADRPVAIQWSAQAVAGGRGRRNTVYPDWVRYFPTAQPARDGRTLAAIIDAFRALFGEPTVGSVRLAVVKRG